MTAKETTIYENARSEKTTTSTITYKGYAFIVELSKYTFKAYLKINSLYNVKQSSRIKVSSFYNLLDEVIIEYKRYLKQIK